jgi:hypothetical protein
LVPLRYQAGDGSFRALPQYALIPTNDVPLIPMFVSAPGNAYADEVQAAYVLLSGSPLIDTAFDAYFTKQLEQAATTTQQGRNQ